MRCMNTLQLGAHLVVALCISAAALVPPFCSERISRTPDSFARWSRSRSWPLQSSSYEETGVLADTREWMIYVDQSKASLEKGASATLDAFMGLAPRTVDVRVAVLPKSSKNKGPIVRCISLNKNVAFEISNVDSVEKVHRVLKKHMDIQLPESAPQICNCLKLKYKGNGYMEAKKLSLAIEAYDEALATGVESQRGVILFMRAAAYSAQATAQRELLQENVNVLKSMVPSFSTLHSMYAIASCEPEIATPILKRILDDAKDRDKQLRRTQLQHGLYQVALLRAAEDALLSVELLPGYAAAWERAGDIMADLWKLKESTYYYKQAINTDESLRAALGPVVDRLHKRQEILDDARAHGWSEETLRLALDIAS